MSFMAELYGLERTNLVALEVTGVEIVVIVIIISISIRCSAIGSVRRRA
jgi:L-lactate permease